MASSMAFPMSPADAPLMASASAAARAISAAEEDGEEEMAAPPRRMADTMASRTVFAISSPKKIDI